MNDKDKKVVNTEEQNRTVNPGDAALQEESLSQDPVKNTPAAGNASKTDKNESSELSELPGRQQGDAETGIERSIPKL